MWWKRFSILNLSLACCTMYLGCGPGIPETNTFWVEGPIQGDMRIVENFAGRWTYGSTGDLIITSGERPQLKFIWYQAEAIHSATAQEDSIRFVLRHAGYEEQVVLQLVDGGDRLLMLNGDGIKLSCGSPFLSRFNPLRYSFYRAADIADHMAKTAMDTAIDLHNAWAR